MISASAPAKIILFGEHAVVYGKPAIAVPISELRVTARFISQLEAGAGLRIHAADLGEVICIANTEVAQAKADAQPLALAAALVLKFLDKPVPDMAIEITSQIPIASGLGSGAAITYALIALLSQYYDAPLASDAANDIVFETEKYFHGNPSGIDNTVIVYERAVYFVRGKLPEFIEIVEPIEIIVADTGIRAPTYIAINRVRELYDSDQSNVTGIMNEIGEITNQARYLLETTGDTRNLGSLMNRNHALLAQLGVSSPELERFTKAAIESGAAGAKLSGGGMGGNMIALVSPETRESVISALKAAGAVNVFAAKVGGKK